MDANKASSTAEYTAAMRADHQLHDQAPVLDDPWALLLITPRFRQRVVSGEMRRFIERGGLRPTQGHLLLRQRFADDALTAATERGVRQLLVLAAGFDSSCLRRDPLLRVIEVDHPASQAVKRARLTEIGVALQEVEFAPIDFEKEQLHPALARTSFDDTQPSFITWLGVSMYISVATALATLVQIRASMAPGSELVFDYQIPVEQLNPRQRELSRSKNLGLSRSGEPRIASFDREQLWLTLAEQGFEQIADVGSIELDHRYCAGRTDGFCANPENRLAHARTTRL